MISSHRAKSTLDLSHPAASIRIIVHSRMTKRTRRQVLLALFKASRKVLDGLESSAFFHHDADLFETYREMNRSVSLHQALDVDSDARAEGLQIRLLRLSFRLSQKEFAELCGLSRTHLSRIERGRTNAEPLTRAKIEFGVRRARARYGGTRVQSAQLLTREREGGEEGPSPMGGPLRRPKKSRGYPFYQGSSSPS